MRQWTAVVTEYTVMWIRRHVAATVGGRSRGTRLGTWQQGVAGHVHQSTLMASLKQCKEHAQDDSGCSRWACGQTQHERATCPPAADPRHRPQPFHKNPSACLLTSSWPLGGALLPAPRTHAAGQGRETAPIQCTSQVVRPDTPYWSRPHRVGLPPPALPQRKYQHSSKVHASCTLRPVVDTPRRFPTSPSSPHVCSFLHYCSLPRDICPSPQAPTTPLLALHAYPHYPAPHTPLQHACVACVASGWRASYPLRSAAVSPPPNSTTHVQPTTCHTAALPLATLALPRSTNTIQVPVLFHPRPAPPPPHTPLQHARVEVLVILVLILIVVVPVPARGPCCAAGRPRAAGPRPCTTRPRLRSPLGLSRWVVRLHGNQYQHTCRVMSLHLAAWLDLITEV